MKTVIHLFFAAYLLIASSQLNESHAQACPLGSQFGVVQAPTTMNQTQTISTCSYLGEHSIVNNLVASSSYSLNVFSNNLPNAQYYVSVYDMTNVLVGTGQIPYVFIPTIAGSYKFQWHTINCANVTSCHVSTITLTSGNTASCSDPISAGSVLTSVPNACLGATFSLTLSNNASSGNGISYQWQSSLDGINFTNISGGTTLNYMTTQSATTYYRCIVTCNNGSSATTSSIMVGMNASSDCYCASQATAAADTEIQNVTISTLNNTSGCGVTGGSGSIVGCYSNFTSMNPTPLVIGNNYPMSVQVTMCSSPNFTNVVEAWIDWNQDGTFDPITEVVLASTTGQLGANTVSANVSVPFTALPGTTRMRVVCVETSNVFNVYPCGTYTWGETEDYDIAIMGDSTFACISGSVYCDNNQNGILDSTDVAVQNAPFILNYNGQTEFTNADSNGNFFFGFSLDPAATDATVSVDAAWMAQNGIQYSSNSMSTSNLVCNSNSSVMNFLVNCDSSNIQTSCTIGLVYCDANNNGVHDNNETVIPYAPVQLSNGITLYTDSLGVFSYSGGQNPSGFLNVSIPLSWLNNNGFALANNQFQVSTDCTSPVPLQIGVDCTPVLCSNLWTSVSPWMGYFQNQTSTIKLQWGSYGPNPSTGYTVTLTYPADVTLNTSTISNPNYIISGNTITWTYPASAGTWSNMDFISFFVPPGFPSGTPHTYSTTITATGTTEDCNLSNNSGALTMILGSSYDPNDKSVSLPPIISPDVQDEFTYLIRFQNTGTAPAQDVFILDTLSSNLDWSTLNIIQASHFMQLIDLGNGLIKFNFPGIWLPDSTENEPESHGRVVFKIKEKANNPLNSEIENTAYIYFDWNEPIITNTTYNINTYPASLTNNVENFAYVYPNPFSSSFRIFSSLNMERITITNVSGQIILQENLSGLEKTLNLEDLANGVYLIEIEASGSYKVVKIIKN